MTSHAQKLTKQMMEEQAHTGLWKDSRPTSYNTSPATSKADWTSPASSIILDDSIMMEKERVAGSDVVVPDAVNSAIVQTEDEISLTDVDMEAENGGTSLKSTQNALFLYALKEKYTLVNDHAIPSIIHDEEILIKVTAIGLNPIDWKGPAFNIGVPGLPWVFGRDLAGVVVQAPSKAPRVKVGDVVLVPSTDYRDIRKAAFQEYAIAAHYNATRIPQGTSIHHGAALGVAFVAAAMALGISFGLDFSSHTNVPGPNLRQILREVEWEQISADVRDECLLSTPQSECMKRGDWIAIWGASTTTGYITLQLAKMYGLKVVCVADVARHGGKLHEAGADVLVDRQDVTRAVEIINGVTAGNLRFGIDMVGRDTATLLQSTLAIRKSGGTRAHLVGMTGLPKERDHYIQYHSVPIKTFHEVPALGESLSMWLEALLQNNGLILPEVIVRQGGGLSDVNDALDLLKSGVASGKRIVIDMENRNI
ncbi:Alcohol dehydrogenase GroES-like domain-containing protein [Cladophialophora immunda]|nr:Alcohol dehydrogenase GroES-like domain-containing protein [Cladophialophora immunda]